MNCQICQSRFGYMIIHEGEDQVAKVKEALDNFSNIGNLVKEVHTVCLKCLMTRAFKCEYCTRHCTRLINILGMVNDNENIKYDDPDYIYYDETLEIYPQLFFGEGEPYYPPGVSPGTWYRLTKEYVQKRVKQNPNFDSETFPDLEPWQPPRETPRQTPRETPRQPQQHQQETSRQNKLPFPHHLLYSTNKYFNESEFALLIKKELSNKYKKYFNIDDTCNMKNVGWYINNKLPIEHPKNENYTRILNLMKETFEF